MVWKLANSNDCQTEDGTQYRWSDYISKLSAIILSPHRDECIVCVNDLYDEAFSTKDDELTRRWQGREHIPNMYMKLQSCATRDDYKNF